MKQRKQMRVYDLYRLAMVGKTSKIRGIQEYKCDETMSRTIIVFEYNPISWIFYCKDEQDHKSLIRCVNRMLHFIKIEDYDMALVAYNDYYNEYYRRWEDEA